ncbi:MAG: hypothetical protein ABR953_03020 [Candidatus Acidiferrales bacterium]|jgi:hypothetical protein
MLRKIRVPLSVMFTLYREKYFDLNVRHFHETLGAEHQIPSSYTRADPFPSIFLETISCARYKFKKTLGNTKRVMEMAGVRSESRGRFDLK